jgi:hypothetical protein
VDGDRCGAFAVSLDRKPVTFGDRHLNLQLVDLLKLLSRVCPGRHSAGAFMPCKRVIGQVVIPA